MTGNIQQEVQQELQEIQGDRGEDFFESSEGTPSRNIVPIEWGYTGTRRPDGLIIKQATPETLHVSRGKVIFFDVTVVSEEHIPQSIENKRKQYRELLRLAEDKGYHVQLVVLPYGVRGFNTKIAKKGLKILGIHKKEINTHLNKTTRHNIYYATQLIWLRNRFENQLENKDNSGKQRFKIFKKLKRLFQKKYPPDI